MSSGRRADAPAPWLPPGKPQLLRPSDCRRAPDVFCRSLRLQGALTSRARIAGARPRWPRRSRRPPALASALKRHAAASVTGASARQRVRADHSDSRCPASIRLADTKSAAHPSVGRRGTVGPRKLTIFRMPNGCATVAILSKGHLVVSGTVSELIESGERPMLAGDRHASPASFRPWEAVSDESPITADRHRLSARGEVSPSSELAQPARLVAVAPIRTTLEDVFMSALEGERPGAREAERRSAVEA